MSLIAIVVSSCLAPRPAMPASDATPIRVSFAIDRVEDQYVVNLPGIRDLFRYFGVGYAGCSIRLSAQISEGIVPVGASDKVLLRLKVKLLHEELFNHREVGSIRRGEVEIYLFNKCDTVNHITIHDARCFDGVKQEFSKLSCPFAFWKGALSVRDAYLRESSD